MWTWSGRRALCNSLVFGLAVTLGLGPAFRLVGGRGSFARLPIQRRAAAPRISPEQAIEAAVGQIGFASGGLEVGADDFRISDMGRDVQAGVLVPVVAFNSFAHEYLVVWMGDDGTPPLADQEFEIYSQRVDAVTGQLLGSEARLSDMGPDGNPNYVATSPAVAYNSTDNEYFVVWSGSDDTGGLDEFEYEIYGQRVNALGLEVGTNDIRLSAMGPDGSDSYSAEAAAVAYNDDANTYLVVWDANDDLASLSNLEYEIYGQLVLANGTPTGTDDFRISDMGPDDDSSYNALTPDVVYNGTAEEFLVVWRGDDNTNFLVENEREIFGQRLSAQGAQVGPNDFVISKMGPIGSTVYWAHNPAVAYNSVENQYLVVWHGDDDTGLLADEELEIFGRRLTADGMRFGLDDLRLSDMGPDGNVNYSALYPDIVYDGNANNYLVTWAGVDDTGGMANGESEVFGQRLDGLAAAIGTNDFRISDMGPNGHADFHAGTPAAAFASTTGAFIVVWRGDDDSAPLTDDEYEVFGQRLGTTGAEQGENDFRISHMGSDRLFDAASPSIAYNNLLNEYFVVWAGDDNGGVWIDDEFDIFGRRVSAATGAVIGDDIRLSDMGPTADTDYYAQQPDVAYSSTANEYLVVWAGSDDTGSLTIGEFEIYGQRVSALGAQLGVDDFRISDMGTDGDAAIDALAPAAVYSPQSNEYLVVWYGDDDPGALVDEEFEIYGQRLSAAGAAQGTNDFRISAVGPDGNSSYSAILPAVAHNSSANEYLVVWHADTQAGGLVDDEYEIYGQLLNAAGAATGADDFRISQMGTDGNVSYYGTLPETDYLAASDEYLVVWQGVDDSLALGEREIFGQRLDGAGALVGAASFQVSNTGPAGDGNYGAFTPVVAAGEAGYLVAWRADTSAGGMADEEFEIFSRQVGATGGVAGPGDFRLSSMGPDGNAAFDALGPAAAYNSTDETYLVVWQGDDDEGELVDGEFEIFGQRYAVGFDLWLPLVSK